MPQLIKDGAIVDDAGRCCARRVARGAARRQPVHRPAGAVARRARAPFVARGDGRRLARARRRPGEMLAADCASLPLIAVDFPQFSRRPRLFDRAAAARRYGFARRTARDRRRAARPAFLPAAMRLRRFRRARGPQPRGRAQGLRDFSGGYQATSRTRCRCFAAARPMVPRRRHHPLRMSHNAAPCRGHGAAATDCRAPPPTALASSFGAEDMVLIDLIAKLALPIAIFTLDTGRLPEETYALIDRARERYGLPIEVYAPDARALEAFVRSHGVNAFYAASSCASSCCAIRKAEPLARALAGRDAWITGPAPRAVGHARASCRSRSSTPRTACRSSIRSPTGAEDDVWAYLRANDVPYNALHDRGYPSIGCAPCTRAVAARRGRPRRALVVGSTPSTRECGLHADPSIASRRNASTRDARHDRSRAILGAVTGRDRRRRRRLPTRIISAGSNPRRSTSCAKWPASAATPPCSSPAARIRWCCCGSPRRRSGPGRFPFPLLHIDTGHNFPEVIAFRDRRAAELGERADRALGGGLDRAGRVRPDAPDESRNRAPVGDAARRDRGIRLRRLHRRRPPRRGKGARQGAHLLVPRRVRPMGSEEPAARAVESVQRAACIRGEHVRVFPISNWTELDVWQYIAREALAVPSIYFAHTRARRAPRHGALVPVTRAHAAAQGEASRGDLGALPHGRRHHLHGAGRIRTPPRSTRSSPRRRATTHHRARRDAPRRPDPRRVDGTAQEGGVFLMSARERIEIARPWRAALPHRRQRRRRQEHADRAPALRHQGDPRRPARPRSSARRSGAARPLDLSLLTDGLVAEREQGITIDVAYRYFATALRKFIIADAPGHEQYTRNMVTAASTAQLAILLVDARHGVLTQTRRHATLAHLLGIPHLVVAVNKMDLARLRAEAVRAIVADFLAFAARTRHRRRALRADVRARRRHGGRPRRAAAPGTTARRCCRSWRPPSAAGARRRAVALPGAICRPPRSPDSPAATWAASSRGSVAVGDRINDSAVRERRATCARFRTRDGIAARAPGCMRAWR